MSTIYNRFRRYNRKHIISHGGSQWLFCLFPIQKITAAIRQLAYGTPADACDEYLRIAESTAIESLLQFCCTINKVFGNEYLRQPTESDTRRLLKVAEARGFPGILGSLDCMHWPWKNCPAAWAGQYRGKEKEPTIILEAVISYELWIWHAFFGMPGSHNDINVLDRSPLFTNLCEGRAPAVNFRINDHTYNMYATLVQTISSPQGPKKKVTRYFKLGFSNSNIFSILQKCRRRSVKMWSAALECCRLNLQLRKAHRVFGRKKIWLI